MSRFALIAARLHTLAAEIAGHSSPTAIAHAVAEGFHEIATHLEAAADGAARLLEGTEPADLAALHATLTAGLAGLPTAMLQAAPDAPAAPSAPAPAVVVPGPELAAQAYAAYAEELKAQNGFTAPQWAELGNAWKLAWSRAVGVAVAASVSTSAKAAQ